MHRHEGRHTLHPKMASANRKWACADCAPVCVTQWVPASYIATILIYIAACSYALYRIEILDL